MEIQSLDTLLLIAVIVGSFYLLAPLVIKITFSIRARPTFKLLEPDELHPKAAEYFTRTAEPLQACGFSIVAYVLVPDQVPNVVAHLALWINSQFGQAALVSVFSAAVAPKSYVEFMTKLSNGIAILTNNSHTLGCFRPVAERDCVQVPWITDVVKLYRLHLSREASLAATETARFLPPDNRSFEYLSDAVEFDIQREAKLGRLYRENNSDLYRATLSGAYMMTWGQLPVIKQIRSWRVRLRAIAQLQAAETHPIITPPKVTITHDSPYRKGSLSGS
jgi:hypothetical protein